MEQGCGSKHGAGSGVIVGGMAWGWDKGSGFLSFSCLFCERNMNNFDLSLPVLANFDLAVKKDLWACLSCVRMCMFCSFFFLRYPGIGKGQLGSTGQCFKQAGPAQE